MNTWLQYLGSIIAYHLPEGRLATAAAIERSSSISVHVDAGSLDNEFSLMGVINPPDPGPGQPAEYVVSVQLADDGAGIMFASRGEPPEGSEDDAMGELVVAVILRVLRERDPGFARVLRAAG